MFDNCRVFFLLRTPHLGALALPLDLVHGVSLPRVLPPALVVLEAAVSGTSSRNLHHHQYHYHHHHQILSLLNHQTSRSDKAIKIRIKLYLGLYHLWGSWTDSRSNGDIVNGDVSQSISPNDTLKHDLENIKIDRCLIFFEGFPRRNKL